MSWNAPLRRVFNALLGLQGGPGHAQSAPAYDGGAAELRELVEPYERGALLDGREGRHRTGGASTHDHEVRLMASGLGQIHRFVHIRLQCIDLSRVYTDAEEDG